MGWARGIAMLLSLGTAWGCGDEQRFEDATLRSPSAMAVGGANGELLFIANTGEDALQVVDISRGLSRLRFLRSEAQYFPLRIPVGRHPSALASTNSGRYIIVFNQVDSILRLVDVETLRVVRDANGNIQDYPVAYNSGGAADMIVSERSCSDPCLAAVTLVLPQVGALLEVDLLDQGAGPQFGNARYFALGGTPVSVAQTHDGAFYFVGDGVAPIVTRVSRATGEITTLNVGDVPGPLAVSGDDGLLIVGRPFHRDVVLFFGIKSSAPALIDANPSIVPRPSCLRTCGDLGDTRCDDAHPADKALCANATGFGTDAATIPYNGVFLGVVPSHILTLGRSKGHQAGVMRCVTDGESYQVYAEFALVAGLDGTIHYVGLQLDGASTYTPHVINIARCETSTLEPVPQSTEFASQPLANYLQPCPSFPPGLDRAECLLDETGTAGVLMFPGITTNRFTGANQSWTLSWEGVWLARRDSGGLIEDDVFRDLGIDLSDQGIVAQQDDGMGTITQPGDILQVLSPPLLGNSNCTLGEGYQGLCELERRIIEVGKDARGGFVRLDTPLPTGCFADIQAGGRIRYVIRTGDSFLVQSSARAHRLEPNARFGPGASAGLFENLSFAVADFDPFADVPACDRYVQGADANTVPGTEPAVAGMDPILTRDVTFGFTIAGAHIVARSGLQGDGNGGVTSISALPTALLLAPAGGAGASSPSLFVTYGGRDALLAFNPFDTASILSSKDSQYAVFR